MSISNNILEGSESLFNAPSAAVAVRVNTDVTPSPLIDKFASITKEELYRMSNSTLTRELDQLADDDILKYYRTLVYLRVLRVRGQFQGSMAAYRRVYRYLTVPSFLYQLLVSIGEVRDDDFNIIFTPVYSINANDLLALDDLIRISELLMRFEYLAKVNGLPISESGELAFMAMHHVNGVVTSYRKDHPVYGFLAAFFKQQEFNEVTGTMHRISYGASDDYELMMTTLMRKYLMGGE